MAHEIDTTTGRAAMAFTGSRDKIWHGLGEELSDGASIEEWQVAAGMEWEVKSSEVTYSIPGDGPLFIPDVRQFQDRRVLYRSDTRSALSVVSSDFKVVQPKEVLEFFRDLVERHDMKLSTAGCLFGGKRFWALAELGKEFEVTSGDVVKGHLLLTTAVDGSLNTTAKFVSERVVCNNTLTIAMGEKNGNLVKVSHRSKWDPDQVKMDLGLIDSSWYEFIANMKKLAETKISVKGAYDFYSDLLFPEEKAMSKLQVRKVEKLMELFVNGQGAEMSRGSLWGVVNGVTELYTHGSGRRDPSHQFTDSYYGNGASVKDLALSKALALV